MSVPQVSYVRQSRLSKRLLICIILLAIILVSLVVFWAVRQSRPTNGEKCEEIMRATNNQEGIATDIFSKYCILPADDIAE